jgi:heme A synthase
MSDQDRVQPTSRDRIEVHHSGMRPRRRFVRYAWAVLALNVAVILWGAYVRATGSGAGCGSHWPLCGGEVVPRSREIATAIEFTHRISSGLALLCVAVLIVAARRVYPTRHIVRRSAAAAGGFVMLEAALGAGLVLFELVAGNASLARGAAGALHLANTYLLLAALALTATLGTRPQSPAWSVDRSVASLGLVALGSLILVGMSGAIAALGDTLFPAPSLGAGLVQEIAAGTHPFVRLRVLHPVIAVTAAALVAGYSLRLKDRAMHPNIGRGAALLWCLLLAQLLAGAADVALLAPVWLQVIHLLFSDLIWILVVVMSAESLTADRDWQTSRRTTV